MQISYNIGAVGAIADLMRFIETKNTAGAGLRWLRKFENFLQDALVKPSSIRHCNNQTFYALGLRCLNFNDWVIAFSIHEDGVIIEAILHSSRITN